MKQYCSYLKSKLDRTIYCKFLNKKININECIGCHNKTYISTGLSRRTKKLAIPKDVKLKVWKRDGGECIFCHTQVPWNFANSHYIKRSQGGLGIEENIITNCSECHRKFDDTKERFEWMLDYAEKYLRLKYPNWDEKNLKYYK